MSECPKCGSPVERVIGTFTRFRCGAGRDAERDKVYQSDACRIRELTAQLAAERAARELADRDLEDAAMCIRRLLSNVKNRPKPWPKMAGQIQDWLNRKGLQGSPLRDTYPHAGKEDAQ